MYELGTGRENWFYASDIAILCLQFSLLSYSLFEYFITNKKSNKMYVTTLHCTLVPGGKKYNVIFHDHGMPEESVNMNWQVTPWI